MSREKLYWRGVNILKGPDETPRTYWKTDWFKVTDEDAWAKLQKELELYNEDIEFDDVTDKEGITRHMFSGDGRFSYDSDDVETTDAWFCFFLPELKKIIPADSCFVLYRINMGDGIFDSDWTIVTSKDIVFGDMCYEARMTAESLIKREESPLHRWWKRIKAKFSPKDEDDEEELPW